jgi:plasmid stability protein
MASLMIRDLDDAITQKLRVRGALRGASVEDEARLILDAVVTSDLRLDQIGNLPPTSKQSAWDLIQQLREKHGTFDLDIPPREAMVGDTLKPAN